MYTVLNGFVVDARSTNVSTQTEYHMNGKPFYVIICYDNVVCKLCGKEFDPETYRGQIVHDKCDDIMVARQSNGECTVCGKSMECSTEAAHATCAALFETGHAGIHNS